MKIRFRPWSSPAAIRPALSGAPFASSRFYEPLWDSLLDAETVTREVARKLMARRRELGLSLAQVSARCGVSLQQIHRYETAANVMSVPMLWQLSKCLDVPVAYFFESLD
jgi:hypothetical protein